MLPTATPFGRAFLRQVGFPKLRDVPSASTHNAITLRAFPHCGHPMALLSSEGVLRTSRKKIRFHVSRLKSQLYLCFMRKLRNEELDRKSVEEFHHSEKIPIILLLDNVRSMYNVGSVFRTADAFLIEGIYLCGFTPTPPHREIQKTALGATETVEWKHFASTAEAISELKKAGRKIFAVEQAEKSVSLADFTPDKKEKMVLVFGNEVEGVQQEIVDQCDGVIEIPQYGMKHSLNISVSAGIVLWNISEKFRN